MNEEILNANENEEVVQPQGGADEREETAAPQRFDVDNMSDDEFSEYLTKLAQNEPFAGAEQVPSPQPQDGDKTDDEGTAKPAGEDNADKPFRVFQSQEDFQSEIDRIVSKRYGELKHQNRSELELLDKLRAQARNFYTDAADDNAAVAELIADLAQQNAEKRGLEQEDYDRQLRDEQDARRWREQQDEISSQQKSIQEIQERWRAESESLKEIVPTFNFLKALENKTFHDAISAGKSVHMAYMLANRQAEVPPQPPARKPISQVAQQKGGMAGKTHVNIDSMTDEEFDRYISQRMNE